MDHAQGKRKEIQRDRNICTLTVSYDFILFYMICIYMICIVMILYDLYFVSYDFYDFLSSLL